MGLRKPHMIRCCRFHEFSEWGQTQILELLLRYQVTTEEELFDILVSVEYKVDESDNERLDNICDPKTVCSLVCVQFPRSFSSSLTTTVMTMTTIMATITLQQNILDLRLKSSNAGVVLGTICLFLHFTQDLPDLQEDVCQRVHSGYISRDRICKRDNN